MKKPLELVIIMDGGLVQEVCSPEPSLIGRTVHVVDFDAEGCDDCVTDSAGDECCPRAERVGKMTRHRYNEVLKLTMERDAQ